MTLIMIDGLVIGPITISTENNPHIRSTSPDSDDFWHFYQI